MARLRILTYKIADRDYDSPFASCLPAKPALFPWLLRNVDNYRTGSTMVIVIRSCVFSSQRSAQLNKMMGHAGSMGMVDIEHMTQVPTILMRLCYTFRLPFNGKAGTIRPLLSPPLTRANAQHKLTVERFESVNYVEIRCTVLTPTQHVRGRGV